MGHIFKIIVHRGADNCFGEGRWFYNIYRNYGKSKFLERILTFNPAFEYHDFVYFRMFLHSKQTTLSPFIYEDLPLY